MRSAEYLNLLIALEMAVKQPKIRFGTMSSSMGIETIEKARRPLPEGAFLCTTIP
jgi:hypothetical protein